ncbi:MlaD family protein [Marinobacterium litorale]|uniref:MlaD family protein n=1 Tax=Marinobacterium litorale TaxID=404770 RepID=UPI000410B7E6|nr:MlaD family protein [Marinobacterium litorale]
MDPTLEQNGDEIRPVVRRHRGPSAVWILPLLAALIAGWLVYKSYSEAGVVIEVQFASAEGLEENKTRVIYRGLPSGTVRNLRLNDDLQSVTAQIEIAAHAEALLREGTRFWLVKPQISLSGVRGLETLVSGHYIAIRPGEGDPSRSFQALHEPPPAVHDEEGLYITLFADSVRAVHRGSPVYYRDITVGEVLDYRLAGNGERILVDVFVESQYAHLVRKHSRFWNASSIEISGKLPEIDIRVGSLATIIAGGVHFYTPHPMEGPEAEDGEQFRLFADYEAAEDGIPVQLSFPGTTQLSVGTEVLSRGVPVGRVRDIKLTEDFDTLNVELVIDPRARALLREGTRFWLSAQEFGPEALNVQSLLRGRHIEMAPGPGQERFSFEASSTPPARPPVYEGLPIRLITERLGSISRGSPILYRQMPIGTVSGFELTDDGRKIQIHAVIEEAYRSLIHKDSRFWNSSGIRFAADIDSGVSLETGSFETLLRGGISLLNPARTHAKEAKENQRFELYPDRDSASDGGALLEPEEQRTAVLLEADQRDAIAVGSPVLLRGVPVGEVSHYALSESGQAVQVRLSVDAPYGDLINSNTRFWVAGGFNARANLRDGVNVRSRSLSQLMKGGIAFATDPDGEPVSSKHRFTLYDTEQASREQAVPIVIHFAPGAELPEGAPIRYRGQPVGRIDRINVAGESGARIARASLFKEARFLAKEGSRFWISEPLIRLSGIENPGNLLFGNHVEALPGQGAPTNVFLALRQPPPYQPGPGITVVLESDRLGSIAPGSPVLFREVPVGKVTGYELNLRGDGVRVYANIDPAHTTLVRASSRFAKHSGVRADAGLFSGVSVDVASLETLVGGGISFTTEDLDAPAADNLSVFRLHDKPLPTPKEQP